MRFHILRACILALLCAPSVAAWAELKIGYVNAVEVIEKAPQGEAALKKLEAEFSPRDKKIVDMQNKIKDLEQEMEKNALMMKEADRREKDYEISTLKRDVQRATQEFREDYNLRRNEELAALQKLVQKAIAEFARQEGYDLIIHEGVVYAGPKVDVTKKILEKLGKK